MFMINQALHSKMVYNRPLPIERIVAAISDSNNNNSVGASDMDSDSDSDNNEQ